MKRKGRPRIAFDEGVVYHMMANRATLKDVARHLKVHRSTVYRHCLNQILEGRTEFFRKWQAIQNPIFEAMYQARLEKERLKQQKKRRRPRGLHPSFWIQ